MTTRAPRYGRKLDDFTPGDVFAHPWDVTIDAGMTAFFAASFQDASPIFASETYAQALGLRGRPVHHYVSLNLALSFSVQDVSEQTIAHLAYLNMRFPEIGYVGDTVSGSTQVIGVKPSSTGDRGVVHVQTVLQNQDGAILCHFDRKALMRAGAAAALPETPRLAPRAVDISRTSAIPAALAGALPDAIRPIRPRWGMSSPTRWARPSARASTCSSPSSAATRTRFTSMRSTQKNTRSRRHAWCTGG